MDALAYLIPAALLLGMIGLGAFFWALKSRQFDDMDGAAMRILIDDGNAAPDADETRQSNPPSS